MIMEALILWLLSGLGSLNYSISRYPCWCFCWTKPWWLKCFKLSHIFVPQVITNFRVVFKMFQILKVIIKIMLEFCLKVMGLLECFIRTLEFLSRFNVHVLAKTSSLLWTIGGAWKPICATPLREMDSCFNSRAKCEDCIATYS